MGETTNRTEKWVRHMARCDSDIYVIKRNTFAPVKPMNFYW